MTFARGTLHGCDELPSEKRCLPRAYGSSVTGIVRNSAKCAMTNRGVSECHIRFVLKQKEADF
jgi:hypothetical protein